MKNAIFLGPIAVDINFVEDPTDDNGEHVDGYFDTEELAIYIREKLSVQNRKLVLAHELVHLLLYLGSVTDSERLARALALPMLLLLDSEVMDLTIVENPF